jgi:hypothetical protein
VDHRDPQLGVEPLERDQGEQRAEDPQGLEAPFDVRQLAPLAGHGRDQAGDHERHDPHAEHLLPARHVRADRRHRGARLAEALQERGLAAHGAYQRAVVE